MDFFDCGDRASRAPVRRFRGVQTGSRLKRRTAGLTLIELLISLAILSTVALLLAGSTHGLRRAMEGILSREKRRGDLDAYFRVFVREIESAFDPGFAGVPPFVLRPGPPADSELRVLSFFAARPESGSDDPARADLVHIRYSVRQAGREVALWRGEQPVRDAPPGEDPEKERVLDRLAELEIQLYTGEAWVSRWPAEGGDPLPRRVRFLIRPQGEGESARTVETLVPASLTVRPTLLRTTPP